MTSDRETSQHTTEPTTPSTAVPRTDANWPNWILRVLSIGFAILILPIVVYGASQAWLGSGTNVEDWLPPGFEETQQLYRFIDRFGSDELMMIGWEGATLGDEPLREIRRRLMSPDPDDPLERIFFREAMTATSVLDELQSPPLNLSERQAKRRMHGWILGRDDATAVLLLVSDDGLLDRRAAVNYARRVATETLDRPLTEIHFAGPTIETVAIDEASQSSLLRLNGYSFLVCVSLLIICLRRLWPALLIFGIALYHEQAAMALVYFCGTRLDSILLLTANLTLVLSVSSGIHMYGYYRRAREQNSPQSPLWIAIRTAFYPTALAAITTAIGFGSLAISHIVPVHKFGFFTAIAAPLAVLSTLWYLAMYLPSKRPLNTKSVRTSDSQVAESPLLRFWPVVFALTIMVVVVGFQGTRQLKISTGIHDLFPDDAKLLADYSWIENRIGPLVPVEVVVEVPIKDDREIIDELQWVGQLQHNLGDSEVVGSVISVLNFTAPIPKNSSRRSIGDIAYRTGVNSGIEKSLNRLTAMRMYRREGDHRLWRITARVAGSEDQNYVEIMKQIRSITTDTLQEVADSDVTFQISGGIPLAAKTQQRLLDDLVVSYLTALALIAVTMAVVLRSPIGGLLTMIPNVIPALVVFGLIGAMGWKIEIGGVMTASAVLGIGIDDSLHLIMAFREKIRAGFNRQRATGEAIRTCAAAMFQTTLVCGLGMLVFALSPFVPIQRFAWLMFSLLGIALLADLILLPCMLYSPLGRFFMPSADSFYSDQRAESDMDC